MDKMREDEQAEDEGLDIKQATVANELESPEGEKTFMRRIEEIVAHLSVVIREGRAGPRIRASIKKAMDEMQTIADNIRNYNPKARFIDAARAKYNELLKKMGDSS